MARLRNYLSVSAVVFAVIAVTHVLRAIQAWPVAIGAWAIPVSASWLAAIGAGALSAWSLFLLHDGNR